MSNRIKLESYVDGSTGGHVGLHQGTEGQGVSLNNAGLKKRECKMAWSVGRVHG